MRRQVRVGLGTAVGVDQDAAARLEALGDVDGLDQRRVEDDEVVGTGDLAAQQDGPCENLRKAVTGAPRRSTPNAGNDCTDRPS
jgi:hypothetical protein